MTDTPTTPLDEKALADVLLAHQPQRSPLGETLCACGMTFKAVDARAWHRHAAAMVENYLAAIPEKPQEAVAWMVSVGDEHDVYGTWRATEHHASCLRAGGYAGVSITPLYAHPVSPAPVRRDND